MWASRHSDILATVQSRTAAPKPGENMKSIKALAVLLLCVGVGVSEAQTVTSGSISGAIVDPQGGVLPGASVVAVHAPTGTTYETTSGTDGRYQILNMRVGGPYTVTVTMPSFRDRTVSDVTVALGEDRSVDVQLELAAVAESV